MWSFFVMWSFLSKKSKESKVVFTEFETLQEICSILKDTPVDETCDISRSQAMRRVNNETPQSTVDIPNPDPNLVQVRASKAEVSWPRLVWKMK